MGSQKGNSRVKNLGPLEKSRIDGSWPAKDLEIVGQCPYCSSPHKVLEYEDAQDWAFHNAPGKWSYWRCHDCDALYITSRPTSESIGRAYSTYYTHNRNHKMLCLRFKDRLKNEFYSHALSASLHPQLHLPKYLEWILLPLNSIIFLPFGLSTLARLPKGKLVDVGCGDGGMLQFAIQMGWDGFGLELDPQAISAGRKKGLTVLEGGYETLDNYPSLFDCIICTHVLEHVYEPIAALEKMMCALKPGGVLLLSCPNARSKASQYFGMHWRGLEAPRHIAIPAAHFLRQYLGAMGFSVEQRISNTFPTIRESMDIQRKALPVRHKQSDSLMKIRNTLGLPSPDQVDFVEFICVKHA